MNWLPDGISLIAAGGLIAISLLTSLLTAGLGIGGGLLLLGVMAMLVPPAALIPLHGVAQLGSNVGRTALLWRFIQWQTVVPFTLGAILGGALGGSVVQALPASWLYAALSIFILYAAWGKWPTFSARTERAGLWLGGLLFNFLSMFIGATGPLVAALLKTQKMPRQPHMATFSASMSLQHCVKIIAFGFLGFQFLPWLALLAAMIASGFIGTWLGERWLSGRADASFHRGLNWLLSALALQLLWQALTVSSA
ncbi:MAG: TSUP family transporter [Paraperlucidibaca sp.]